MSPNTFQASSLKISPLLPKVSLLNSIPLNFLCVLFPARPLAETSHVPLQLLSFLLNHASIIVSHLPLSHCVLVFASHESAKLISQVGYLGRLMVLSTFYVSHHLPLSHAVYFYTTGSTGLFTSALPQTHE